MYTPAMIFLKEILVEPAITQVAGMLFPMAIAGVTTFVLVTPLGFCIRKPDPVLQVADRPIVLRVCMVF